MRLGRLSASGIARFSAFLDQATLDPALPPPVDLLDSPEFSEQVSPRLEVNRTSPATRHDLAAKLHAMVESAGLTEAEKDVGLWTWLSILYFDAICPTDGSGRRRFRERAAYIPEPGNFQRYYRHLLLGPYLIYRGNTDFPERAMAFLCKPPHVIDDVVAQLASRQELVTNKSVVELATLLYYDAFQRTLRRGAGGKGRGSARRLADVLSQFDVTWDLYAMTTVELLRVLPPEFERFKKADSGAADT